MKKLKFLSILVCLSLFASCFATPAQTKVVSAAESESDYTIFDLYDSIVNNAIFYSDFSGNEIDGGSICENLNYFFGTKKNKNGAKFQSLDPKFFTVKNNKKVVFKKKNKSELTGMGRLKITVGGKEFIKYICNINYDFKKCKYKRIGKNKVRVYLNKPKNIYKRNNCKFVYKFGYYGKGKNRKIRYSESNILNMKFSKNYKYGIGIYPALKLDLDNDGIFECTETNNSTTSSTIELNYSKKGMKYLNKQKLNKKKNLFSLERKLYDFY